MLSRIFIIFFIAIIFIGCNNRFVLRKNKLSENYDELISYIKKQEDKVNTYSIKYTGSFENNKQSLKFRGMLRIIRGEQIWISISPMGIEAARLLFTQDNIKFMNRQDNTYFVTDYSYLQKKFNVDIDYNFVEQVLTNRLMAIPDTLNNSVSKTNEGFFNININENNATKEFILNPEYQKLTSIIFKDVTQKAGFTVVFKDYVDIKSNILPRAINFKLNKEDNYINLDLNYKKIVLNSSFKIPFRIPSKYEQIWP
jgi:hypothetical protein